MSQAPAIWFPAVRCGTGADVFTETLVAGLRQQGLQAEITWLPHHAEYLPWAVPVPQPPAWANVVHINTWLHPRFIPKHLPIVATLHHSIHDPALKPYKGWLRAAYHQHWVRRIERATMQRADTVVAVSKFAAQSAQERVLQRPMQIIYNGVDTERFQPAAQSPGPAQGLRPFRLLYVGSWMARKGVDLLAPIMRELGSKFELHYTGGAAAEKDKSNMPPNMIDLGRLSGDAVIAAMQEADALMFPSRSEGLPLSVLEAMACGLPVIGTRETAVAELVLDGETGMLCSGKDSAEFVQAAQRLADDGQLCLKMRRATRQRVIDSFSSTMMINSYIDQYVQLATSVPPQVSA